MNRQKIDQGLWFKALQQNPPNWNFADFAACDYEATGLRLGELDEVVRILGIDPIPSETTRQGPK